MEKHKPYTFYERKIKKLKSNDVIYHGNILEFQAAPSPTDVFWTNLHYNLDQQAYRKLIGNIVLFILMCLSIYIAYQLAVYQ